MSVETIPLTVKISTEDGLNLRLEFSRILDFSSPEDRRSKWSVEHDLSQLRWNGTDAFYEFPPVYENVCALRSQFKDAEYTEDAALLCDSTMAVFELAERRAAQITAFMKDGTVPHITDYEFKRKSMDHQLIAFDCARRSPFFGLLMQMGTGKTKVINDTLSYLAQNRKTKRPLRVLIVCPRSVLLNWARELKIDVGCEYVIGVMTYISARYKEELESLNCVSRGGGDFKSVEVALELTQHKDVDMQILITNYDTLKGRLSLLKKMKFDVCVLDESHMIKRFSTQRTKHCLELAETCKHRYILTGTPLTQSPFDLWTQFEFLGPKMGLLGYTNFHAFQHNIASFGGYRGRKVERWHGLGKVLQAMAKWSFTIKKEQCLDLPSKVYEIRTVEMSTKQTEIYNQVARDVLLRLEGLGAEISIQNVLVEYLRLAQVTSGFIKDIADVEHKISSSKIDAMMEMLEVEDWPKTIIWGRFIWEIKEICAALKERGIKYVEYHGGVSGDKRQLAVDSFQDDDKVKVFVGTPSSGGLGINLTAASFVIYASNDFNLGHRLQSEDRSHRIGQKNSVTYVDLICENTIDELMYERLLQKREMANFFSDPEELKNSLIDFLRRT